MNIHHSSSESWTSAQYKNCTGADVDGDGFEEVVVVYYDDSADTLNLVVVDNSGEIYEEYGKTIVAGVTSVPALPHYQPALAAGDFDGDDRDEIFVGFTHHVYMLEDKDSDYAVTISPSNYSSTTDLYLAAGDVDWDQDDELVVTHHSGGYAYCDVFDGDISTPVFQSGALNNTFTDGIHSMTAWYEQHVHVCVGDIDGDPYEEIVLHGECRDLWAAFNGAEVRSRFTRFRMDGFSNRHLLLGLPTDAVGPGLQRRWPKRDIRKLQSVYDKPFCTKRLVFIPCRADAVDFQRPARERVDRRRGRGLQG
jgi:hypothetical protein